MLLIKLRHNSEMKRLLLTSLLLFIPLPAQATCSDSKGYMQICREGKCFVDNIIETCSGAMSGSHWRTKRGFQFGYIPWDYKKNKKRKEPIFSGSIENILLYEGDPKKSPWSFDICGGSRFEGGPCNENHPWSKKAIEEDEKLKAVNQAVVIVKSSYKKKFDSWKKFSGKDPFFKLFRYTNKCNIELKAVRDLSSSKYQDAYFDVDVCKEQAKEI